ncbi:MAG: hypothetical protein ACJAXW_003061 [Candidatus Azotimanducaceae bacterium]|jgi:hypothetical protein
MTSQSPRLWKRACSGRLPRPVKIGAIIEPKQTNTITTIYKAHFPTILGRKAATPNFFPDYASEHTFVFVAKHAL